MLEAVLRRSKNRDDLFALLAETGHDAIGDLTIRRQDGWEPKTLNAIEDIRRDLPDFIDSLDITAVSGVQPKMLLRTLSAVQRARTPRRSYLVKVPSHKFRGLVENEFFFMEAARRCGIRTARTKLYETALVVTRFDRVYDPDTKSQKQIHVEDGLQLLNQYNNAKYTHSFEELLRQFVEVGANLSVLLECLELYVFSYIIGNGDLHEKNISLLRDPDNGQWVRTPAYDLVSTLPYGAEIDGADRMALALSDENYGRFTRNEFNEFGESFGLKSKAVSTMIDRLVNRSPNWLSLLPSLPYSPEVLAMLESEITARLGSLTAP